MGYEAEELGYYPFVASHLEGIIKNVKNYKIEVLPSVSAFIGGDIVGGILSCEMHKKEEISLLIDLGTNGEMVLGNCHKMIACSTAAGPSFERSGICGSDLVKLLATLLEEEIIAATGLLTFAFF